MHTEAWLWFAAGMGFGAQNTGAVLEAFPQGVPQVLENLHSAALLSLLAPVQAKRLAASGPADFAQEAEKAEADGLCLVCFSDPAYPALLRHIPSPPPVLWCRGDVSLLNSELLVGMVGTRRPSAYGVQAVKEIGTGLAEAGAVIVSGLAAGLDSEAHKAALSVDAPTIACIAFGHSHCYPAANRKLMEVIGRAGLVVGEYPTGTKPEQGYFLQRNRIIAGISHGLLVAEARRRSGTLNTVSFAAAFGRDVFAVPGSIFSPLAGGTNDLIREGAYLASSAKDVLAAFGYASDEPAKTGATPATKAADERPVSAGAKSLYKQLTATPQTLEALCSAAGLSPRDAMAALGELEMAGLCAQQPGRRYVAQ